MNTKDKIKFGIGKLINARSIRFAFFVILQILAFVFLSNFLIEYFALYTIMMPAILILIYLNILKSDQNSGYKIIWISLLAVFPIIAIMMYGSQYSDIISLKLNKRINLAQDLAKLKGFYKESDKHLELLKEEDKDAYLISNYLTKYGIYPLELNTQVQYFPDGQSKYEALKEKMRNAKKYIYLEYFIVLKGDLFHEIIEILKAKVAEGVDVRLMYDEFGVMGANGEHFNEEIKNLGIQLKVFNPIGKFLSISLNNRNHRKIAVIDGEYGFMGGINMADEYVNLTAPLGYWKDTAIMLTGNAVNSLNTMFLSMWDALSDTPNSFSDYSFTRSVEEFKPELGFVQPYFDNSFDSEPLSENIYFSIISKAKSYVKIATPYLIPTDELIRALKVSAQSGVDVAIVVPYIQDKKYVRLVNHSYYYDLIKNGVKIYEFLPGFVHAKMIVSDDKFATVGSVNFDYRSFYLNLECGCFLYNNPAISDINKDFDYMISNAKLVTLEDLGAQNVFKRFFQALLRTFAPLM